MNLVELISTFITSINSELVLIGILVVAGALVLERVQSAASEQKKKTGFEKDAVAVSVDGSKSHPARNYVSDMQGLAGKPDALIIEDGFIIPVERKPLAKKLHDRYVAQLLVYMRLVEEFEGKRPPHGYLILGPNCRRFKVENSEEKQAWLQGLLDEMRGILENGDSAKAAPHPRKCKKCDVREACTQAIDAAEPVQIGTRAKVSRTEKESSPNDDTLEVAS